MKIKTKINVKLLRKVQRTILAEPRKMDMTVLISTSGNFRPEHLIPPCGTIACIAGEAAILCGVRVRSVSGGAKLLGLNVDQENRLCFQKRWPEPFRSRLSKLRDGTKRYARVVSARIDHFIKTKGAE